MNAAVGHLPNLTQKRLGLDVVAVGLSNLQFKLVRDLQLAEQCAEFLGWRCQPKLILIAHEEVKSIGKCLTGLLGVLLGP